MLREYLVPPSRLLSTPSPSPPRFHPSTFCALLVIVLPVSKITPPPFPYFFNLIPWDRSIWHCSEWYRVETREQINSGVATRTVDFKYIAFQLLLIFRNHSDTISRFTSSVCNWSTGTKAQSRNCQRVMKMSHLPFRPRKSPGSSNECLKLKTVSFRWKWREQNAVLVHHHRAPCR